MKLKSLLHYDIILEKFDKLVKIKKMAKCGNIGPSSLKRMPATNGLLKKIPTPHGDIVGSYFFHHPWSQFFQRDTEEEFMDLPKLWFREIGPSLGVDQKLSKYELLVKYA